MTCDWAACNRPGDTWADGWVHCRRHLQEHHAQQAEAAAPPEKLKRYLWDNPSEELTRLHALGYTDRMIATAMTYTPGAVRRLRANLHLPVNPATPTIRACGTAAGYRRHQYRREPACDPCAQARREFDRVYQANRRAKAAHP